MSRGKAFTSLSDLPSVLSYRPNDLVDIGIRAFQVVLDALADALDVAQVAGLLAHLDLDAEPPDLADIFGLVWQVRVAPGRQRVPAATASVVEELRPVLGPQEKVMAEGLAQRISSISSRRRREITKCSVQGEEIVPEEAGKPLRSGGRRRAQVCTRPAAWVHAVGMFQSDVARDTLALGITDDAAQDLVQAAAAHRTVIGVWKEHRQTHALAIATYLAKCLESYWTGWPQFSHANESCVGQDDKEPAPGGPAR